MLSSQSQLRNHEREHHSCSSDTEALTPVTESSATVDEAGQVTDEGKTCFLCTYYVLR